MDKYTVKLTPRSIRDIEEIYMYISTSFKDNNAADNLVDLFEKTIFSLEIFPYRGAERKIGKFSRKGYRQLFAKNFTIIYKVDEINNQVIIMTVKYSPMNF